MRGCHVVVSWWLWCLSLALALALALVNWPSPWPCVSLGGGGVGGKDGRIGSGGVVVLEVVADDGVTSPVTATVRVRVRDVNDNSPSICPSVCPSVRLSVCLSVSLSVWQWQQSVGVCSGCRERRPAGSIPRHGPRLRALELIVIPCGPGAGESIPRGGEQCQRHGARSRDGQWCWHWRKRTRRLSAAASQSSTWLHKAAGAPYLHNLLGIFITFFSIFLTSSFVFLRVCSKRRAAFHYISFPVTFVSVQFCRSVCAVFASDFFA